MKKIKASIDLNESDFNGRYYYIEFYNDDLYYYSLIFDNEFKLLFDFSSIGNALFKSNNGRTYYCVPYDDNKIMPIDVIKWVENDKVNNFNEIQKLIIDSIL